LSSWNQFPRWIVSWRSVLYRSGRDVCVPHVW
jgi:hypothetical protein